jgi:hypothetical protein
MVVEKIRTSYPKNNPSKLLFSPLNLKHPNICSNPWPSEFFRLAFHYAFKEQNAKERQQICIPWPRWNFHGASVETNQAGKGRSTNFSGSRF